MPGVTLTEQELLDFIVLVRSVEHRLKLDRWEEATLAELGRMVDRARREIAPLARELTTAVLSLKDPLLADEIRLKALSAELDKLLAAIRLRLSGEITSMAVLAGLESFGNYNDILSFDGRVAGFNMVSLSAAQLAEYFRKEPLQGLILEDWLKRIFSGRVTNKVIQQVRLGLILGESVRTIVEKRLDFLERAFGLARRDVITIARTYVQEANVRAMTSVYAANPEVVKKVKWSAVLEPSYSSTGHGTCLRCAALDGQEFPLGKHPPCPLHFRCRCVLQPVTVSWRELGLDMDEIREAYRPYVMRPRQTIGAGRLRLKDKYGNQLEVGRHGGDYEEWLKTRDDEYQVNALGPKRYELWKRGKVKMADLVDIRTGRLKRLDELPVSR